MGNSSNSTNVTAAAFENANELASEVGERCFVCDVCSVLLLLCFCFDWVYIKFLFFFDCF